MIDFFKYLKMPLQLNTSRPISCFGTKVHGFKVCDCILDVTFGALEKIDSINELWRIYKEKCKFGLETNLLWTYHARFFIGCCRAHMEWLIETSLPPLPRCDHIRAESFHKCYYNLNVSLNDFCYVCLDALSDILNSAITYI